jgi:hypothetical protein
MLVRLEYMLDDLTGRADLRRAFHSPSGSSKLRAQLCYRP